MSTARSMTRAHIADPHLIAKIKMGQIDQIKKTIAKEVDAAIEFAAA